jgi:putative membrane protein insertion efficiency factor
MSDGGVAGSVGLGAGDRSAGPGRRRLWNPLVLASLALVRAWQLTLSGRLGRCRFTPTCSQYAAEAIARHGFVRGWGLAIHRVQRCAPGKGRGHDPVPAEI